MAIDFPNLPATNDTYAVGNKTWIYDGTTWNTYNTISFSAETLPGTNLKSTVTGSSLTSVGTLTGLAVTGPTIISSTSGDTLKVTNTGLGNSFVVEDVASDTTPFVIDAAGRVGIGTSTPGSTLEVLGGVYVWGSGSNITTRQASGNDGVIISGRAGGTSNYNITLTPVSGGLTSSKTQYLPDVTGVYAVFTTGDTAWTSYTPTLTQTATVTKTVTRAVYCKIGRLVIAQVQLAVTSAGTSGGAVLIGLPVTAAASGIMCGSMSISSTGTSVYTHGPALANTTSVFGMLSTAGNYYGINPSTALASGNVIQATLTYEAAS